MISCQPLDQSDSKSQRYQLHPSLLSLNIFLESGLRTIIGVGSEESPREKSEGIDLTILSICDYIYPEL